MDLPEQAERLSVVERYARLLVSVGDDMGTRPLVLPNGDFFPDRFTGDASSLAALVERMLGHAGLADVPVTARVVGTESAQAGGGCGTGSCGVPSAASGGAPRLVDDGDGWILSVPADELRHPVVLTTMVARALGHVLLFEVLPTGARPEEPAELTADYAAVGLGFGPLLLEGAYIYSKSCGGPSVAQVTRAALPELAVLVALFIEMGGHAVRPALRELGTTQSSLLREAHDWVRETRGLKETLVRSPEIVAAGGFSPSARAPWLSRVFGGAGTEREASPRAERAQPAPPRPRDAASAELRALVDEALAAARTDAE